MNQLAIKWLQFHKQIVYVQFINEMATNNYMKINLVYLQLHSGGSSNFDFTSQPAKVTVVAPHLVEAIDQEMFEGFTFSILYFHHQLLLYQGLGKHVQVVYRT